MSSPFAAQLGTNYCPRDDELAQIKDLLNEPCLRLKRLDDEIAVMRKALDKLSEQRDALDAYVQAHKALMSPIRRLPLDIIEEIFMACLPTHRNCVMSAQEAPVILGRICSSWRTISLSTPRLWLSLHIVEPSLLKPPYHLGTPRDYPSEAGVRRLLRLEVANAWLRRSGHCPLSISLEGNPDQPMPLPINASAADPDPFLIALIQFASRWQNIRLVAHPRALETLSGLTENDVPLLNQLEIVHSFEDPHNTDNAQWSVSQSGVLHAPSLSRVSMPVNNMKLSDFPLRWNQLTALSLSPSWVAWPVQTCLVALDILSKCPQLRFCKLDLHDYDGELADSVVECLFLHTLDLFCNGSPLRNAGYLLNRLSLPALRDFSLCGLEHSPDSSITHSLSSSLTASPRLETISIDSSVFTKSYLMDFLRGLPPTIRRFHITEPYYSHGLRAALDDDDLAALATYHPALQELVILNCGAVSDDALLRFIVSRMPTLRLVDIKFNRERQVDILPSLQPFMEDGLQISLTYLPTIPRQFSPWQGLPDAPPQSSWQPWHAYN